MTVQDLFKSIDENDFLENYLKNDEEILSFIFNEKYTDIEKRRTIVDFKEKLRNHFRELKKMKINANKNFIVFTIPKFDGDTNPDSFAVQTKEIIHYKIGKTPETYGIEFTAHNEILGYEISLATRTANIDDIYIALSIYKGMTFLGIGEKEHHKKVEAMLNSINESQKFKTKQISYEEMIEQYGFEDIRTQTEKDFDVHILGMQGKNDVQIFNEYIGMEQFYRKN